jgi:sugar transferase EpsL
MKRFFELFLIVLSLPISLPITLFVAMSIRVILGSPILFFQNRPGLDGKPFKIVKFCRSACLGLAIF